MWTTEFKATFLTAVLLALAVGALLALIEQMQVPQQWPEGRFDLILFSEVLYFLNESDLLEICAHTGRSIQPGGQVLLVNYTGETDDPCSGEKAASFFITATSSSLQPIFQSRAPHYRLDLLARR